MKPVGRNIVIKLPAWQKNRERTSGRIIIPHLKGFHDHNATHGTVMDVSENCTLVKKGDEVFFTIMAIQQGLQKVGRDETRQDAWTNVGTDSPVFYMEQPDADYLIMPEQKITRVIDDPITGQWEELLHSGVICLIREGEVICLNDYYLMERAAAYADVEMITVNDFLVGRKSEVLVQRTSGLIVGAALKDPPEKQKKYKITHAPEESEVQADDIVINMPHTDLCLEGSINAPLFPKDTFYVEKQYMLATLEPVNA